MKKNSSGKLLRTTVLVSGIVLFGKLQGFFREALIAGYYGATAETDAFFFAQNMPGMIFPSVCNSVSTAFLSLYAVKLARERPEDADRYASRMLLACLMLGLALSGAGAALSPLLVPLLAPGFWGEQLGLSVRLTQMTMGAFVLTMLQYMLGAILNAKKRFLGSQTAALFYSGTVILATLLLGRGRRMEVLTLTVILGYFMHAAALVFCCRGCFRPTLRANPFHRDTAQLFRLSLPILLGNAAYQINTIVDQALGSLLPEGSLSALSYSHTLTLLVTSVCITSLSTVLYPTLAEDAAKENLERYGERMVQSLSVLTWLLIPVSLLTLLRAEDIVSAVYNRGSFDRTAVSYTGAALAGYALMFIGTGVREVLTRAFYARQDTKTPMVNTLISIGCNVILSILLSRYLGLAGIALGTTLSCTLAACLLLRDTKRKLPFVRLSGFFSQFRLQLLAGAVLCAALVGLHRLVEPPHSPFWRFALDTFAGFAVYIPVSLLTGGIRLRQKK